MSEDYVNIRLSGSATETIERIEKLNLFENKINIAKFAMAYAIKNYRDEFDPLEIDQNSDASGVNYNIGTVDSDNFISKFIEICYPNTNVPYRIIRGLMIYGLGKLDELLEEGKLWPLSNIM